ncbi:coagulation factor XIII A chain-like [Xyrauchen texanus]|uniref:coagulation factor XIII A chain-like n=1 Tax=Xyrauchen texanus TaxID=154827 RepID=UPI0022423098|nr:coagulation factor XIII A chain-like [Xyrauchen texanus]
MSAWHRLQLVIITQWHIAVGVGHQAGTELDLAGSSNLEICIPRCSGSMEVFFSSGRGSPLPLIISMGVLMGTSARSILSRPINSSTNTCKGVKLGNEEPWRPHLGRINIDKSNLIEFNPPVFESLIGSVTPRGPIDGTSNLTSLSVVSVDMHKEENKNLHHTDMYKNSNLIVRRNQEFTITIKFDRAFDEKKDNTQLEFLIGSEPDENKGTYIIVFFGAHKGEMPWQARVVTTQGNDVTIGITPAVSCIIGRFRTFVTIVSDSGKQRTQRDPDTDLYVLFNPWDPVDQVYMPEESNREEYLLNEVGTIYNGEFDNVNSRSWNYGQFQKGVLDACLLVMDAGKVPLIYRGNATQLARQGSALMNAQDDDGVLVGNWSGEYSSGTAPTAWTGSPEILLKYANEGCVPVCFAQCWVFAGVLNTFLRCLGIPARVITNFCSAHDNSGNLTTDIVLDENGRVDRENTRDSIWNYHCWNEMCIKRADLQEKYSGWQVIDCTPQETSDGLYRCGPTSVNAIKEGELSFQFDARFVFAELNSDVIFHKSDKFGKTKVIYVDTAYVGKLIVTKKVNSSDYENITSNYKYPEGTVKERETMQLAVSRGVPPRDYVPLDEAGVDIDIQTDTVKMSDNFTLTLNIKNQSSKTCNVQCCITGCVVYYTGVTSSSFKFETKDVTVQPLSTQTVRIAVRAVEYMPYLVEQSNLLFNVYGYIEDSDVSISKMRVVTLRPPELLIKVTGTPRVGKDFMVSVEFMNPYNFILKDVVLRLDGPGLIQTKTKKYKQILPGGSVKYKESIFPLISGKKKLLVCLDCKALRQVTGEIDVEVLKA